MKSNVLCLLCVDACHPLLVPEFFFEMAILLVNKVSAHACTQLCKLCCCTAKPWELFLVESMTHLCFQGICAVTLHRDRYAMVDNMTFTACDRSVTGLIYP